MPGIEDFKTAVTPAEESRAMIEIEQQRAIAEAQAAMVVAKRFPRDVVKAMDRIMQACTRPALAEAAVYQYARGGSNIEGPSIRLAEVLAQNWGNIRCGVIEASRKMGESECIAYAWDLETNFYDEKKFAVRHIRDKKGGNEAITAERDIYELIANMGARRKRACILSVIPGDVVEGAVHQCAVTLATKAEVTPERIKSLEEKFMEFGVTKAAIEKRIQRRLDAITPALLVQLGKIYNSLKDGMSQAIDWFDFGPDTAPKKTKDSPGPDSSPPRAAVAAVSGQVAGGPPQDMTKAQADAFAMADDAVRSKDFATARSYLDKLSASDRKVIEARLPK